MDYGIILTSNMKNINKMINDPDLFKKEYEEQILFKDMVIKKIMTTIFCTKKIMTKLNLGYLENYDLLINKLDNKKVIF